MFFLLNLLLLLVLVLLLFHNFSLYFLLFLNLLYIVFFIIIFTISNKLGVFSIFKRFYYHYLLLEIILDLLLLLSYFLNIKSFFFIMYLFKSNIYPFVYYKFLINTIVFNYLFDKFLFIYLFLIGKFFIITIIITVPISFNSIIVCLILLNIYFLLTININYLINSFIISNLVLLIIGQFFNIYILFFYLLISIVFQYKSLCYFSCMSFKKDLKLAVISLSFINGNPLFLFNWLEILIYSLLLNYSLIIPLVFTLSAIVYLIYSFYIFNIYFYINSFIFYLLSIFIFNLLLLFYFDQVLNIYLSILQLNSPQYNFNLISFNSYISYVVIGENLSLSIMLLLFILNFYYNYNIFPNLLGISFGINILKYTNRIYIKFLNISFNFNIDLVVLFFLYINLIIFSNNFDFLSSERMFRTFKNTVVFIMKQWDWFGYTLSLNNRLRFNFLYNIFIYSSKSFTSSRIHFPNLYTFYLITVNVFKLRNHNIFNYRLSKFYLSNVLNSNMVLYCISLDVIHSLFIKTLVLKLDIFYGRVSFVNLREYLGVLNNGSYLEFICYEYCGLYHYNMRSMYLVLVTLDFSFFNNIYF